MSVQDRQVVKSQYPYLSASQAEPAAGTFPLLIVVTPFPGRVSPGHSIEKEMQMATGTVKWFNDSKGFGFITPSDGGKDLFAHHTETQSEGHRSLTEGQKVEFEPIQGQKGPAASKIRAV